MILSSSMLLGARPAGRFGLDDIVLPGVRGGAFTLCLWRLAPEGLLEAV